MVLSDGLKDKLKGLFRRQEDQPRFSSMSGDDFETNDKQLKALRRQKRRQMDIVEREQLRKSIQNFEIEKGKKDFVGDSGLVGSKVKRFKKPRKQSFIGGGGFI